MKLLITRSEPGASRMAGVLGAAGVESVVHPLIQATKTRFRLEGDCFDHVIFVSEHAVAHGRDAVKKLADGAQWYAIGPATGAALAKLMLAGRPADAGRIRVPTLARSEGLLAESELQAIEGSTVLLVAGEKGRDLIARTLKARGATVTSWLVYRRVEVDGPDCHFPPVDACVASSGVGLELLTRAWFKSHASSGAGTQVPVCVPSPRIAEMARQLGWKVPILCDGASAEATLVGLADAGLI